MKQFTKFLVIFILIISFPIWGQSPEIIKVFDGKDSIEVYKDQITVKIKTDKDVIKLLDPIKNIKEIGKFSKHRFGVIKLKSNSNLFDSIEKLKKSDAFEIVEPRLVWRAHIVPNDEHYTSGEQYAIDKIRLPEAWDITTGTSSITIGILDSGLPIENGGLSHQDINESNRYLLGIDEVGDGNGVKDELGHGTLVTGIIGAETNNTTGISGSNWSSKIKMYQVFTANNQGDPQYFADGVYDAVDDGVRVINYSGGGSYSSIADEAIQYARDNNVLVVCSAGNTYLGSVKYPAALSSQYDNLIAVSATDNNDQIADFSSIGNEVTVSAPGDNIYSTTPNYSSFYLHDNSPYLNINYDQNDGTSFAAPYVTGVASLIYAINDDLSPAQVRDILEKTALDKGDYGKDDYFGYGRLNAYRAVRATQILTLYSEAEFVTDSKSSSVSLDRDWYYQYINELFYAQRYKMDVTFNKTDYFNDTSNALIWFNSNGWSSANPLSNPSPWYQIISQSGSSVTIRTYTYKLIDLVGNIFWSTPPEELKIDILGYGEPHLPLSVSISGPSTGPCETGTWNANVSGGYSPYSYQWYHMYTSDGITLEQASTTTEVVVTPNRLIDTWYAIGTDNPTLNYYLCGGDSYLRVDVTDSHNSTVSTQYFVAGATTGDGTIPLPKNSEYAFAEKIPDTYQLEQNYPNPFNPTTQIKYAVKQSGFVTIKVYNSLGKTVATLVNENKSAGFYIVNFDASRLASGIYFYTIKTNDFYDTKKMILIK